MEFGTRANLKRKEEGGFVIYRLKKKNTDLWVPPPCCFAFAFFDDLSKSLGPLFLSHSRPPSVALLFFFFFFYRILICIVSHRRYRCLQAAFGPTTGGKMWVVLWNRKGEKRGRELDNDKVNRGKGTSRFGQLNEWKLKVSRSFWYIREAPRRSERNTISRSWFVIDHSLICPAADVLHNSKSLITFVESWDESRTDYGVSGTISTPKEFACGFENSRDCYSFHFDLPLDSRE